ncbi:hypothetical protein ACFWPU_00790 [Streptomyces sp. NPDC058471]|uniref:hypothetical protein n=1 Tax=Streptomyces sp. NPDC058471 TaxID=3346516 RepID=UPI0036554CD5
MNDHGIFVTDDTVTVRGLTFEGGIPVIDTGGRRLEFANNQVWTATDGEVPGAWAGWEFADGSTITSNVFLPRPTPKKWWRFW